MGRRFLANPSPVGGALPRAPLESCLTIQQYKILLSCGRTSGFTWKPDSLYLYSDPRRAWERTSFRCQPDSWFFPAAWPSRRHGRSCMCCFIHPQIAGAGSPSSNGTVCLANTTQAAVSVPVPAQPDSFVPNVVNHCFCPGSFRTRGPAPHQKLGSSDHKRYKDDENLPRFVGL